MLVISRLQLRSWISGTRLRDVTLGFGLFVFTACSAYTPPMLTAAHPAHPEAETAPELPPSNTLAYSQADLPSVQPAVATMAMAPGAMSGVQVADAGSKTVVGDGTVVAVVPSFVGEGKVVAVVPNTQQVVIDHGDIKGFMGAMTMGFQVASPSLLKGLQAGDPIRFTIDAQEKVISKIEKMNP
jgi:Cu/Ag efflux protein CusF